MWDVPLISPLQRAQTCAYFPLGYSLLWPRVNWSNWELTHPTRVILLIFVKGKLHHWEDPLCISVLSLPSQDNRISENDWKPQPVEAQPLSSSLPAFVLQAGLP